MRNTSLRLLILFGTAALTGLFIIQIYWFQRAFSAESQEFDHSVRIALKTAADSVSPQAEVKRLSNNFYFVATESHFNSESLNTHLRSEFTKRDLPLEYELGVYNAEDDTLVYGQYVEATRKHKFNLLSNNDKSQTVKNFAVYFPKKHGYVLARLDVWIISTVGLLMMMCLFAYAIATVLRERRFAEIKSDFINNMTHEFKTPVTNIGITGEIIRKKMPEHAGLNVYVDILLKENEKLRKKIDQVLLASSVEAHHKPSYHRLDINHIIAECVEAFELKIRERSGVLQLDLNAKSAYILGDRELLAQAINNVIDNAEKYSPTKPHIVVTTQDQADCIEIRIIDRGIGIPENAIKSVFQKFFRVRRGDVHNVKGFGLGLSFVKSVIQSHRGKVRLFSAVNEGTQVKIILPKA